MGTKRQLYAFQSRKAPGYVAVKTFGNGIGHAHSPWQPLAWARAPRFRHLLITRQSLPAATLYAMRKKEEWGWDLQPILI